MKIPSYTDKTYIVMDNDARIRREDNLAEVEIYQAGDQLPIGASVGEFKRLPKRTEVKVTGVKTNAARTVFVYAEPVNTNDAFQPSGWTKASNLDGGMLNELVGYTPARWDCSPGSENFTVTDKQALIRGGAPAFASTGKSIPAGTYVVVTERANSGGKTYVKVCNAEISDGQISATDEIGWTSASNLTDGCTNYFSSKDWLDQKGANACWRLGSYIGTKILVDIIGVGGEMEQITYESVAPYFALRDAAAEVNLQLAIESGFRTYQRQADLYNLYLKGKGNLAARPGRSNHQHGQAFDLNTGGFDGNPIYDWLKKNGPKFGFLRTVNGEHWHWEYLPNEAPKVAAKGGFKTFAGGR